MAKKRIYTEEELQQVNNRVGKIRTELCNDDNKLFAQKLGLSTQATSNLCNSQKSVGRKTIEKILEAFPQVNRLWLVMGVGEMMEKDSMSVAAPITPTEKLYMELDEKNEMIGKLLSQQEQFLNIISNLSSNR